MLKPSFSPPRLLRVVLVCCASLCLVSCDETEKVRQQTKAAQEKLQQMQQETFKMDAKMVEYRYGIPAYAGQGEEGAKRYAMELAKELASLENEITLTKKSIQDAQAALVAARAEVETLKSKDPRLVK